MLDKHDSSAILKLQFMFQEKVRSQDAVFVIGSTTGSVVGRELAWEFMKNKFSILNERYEGGFLLSRLVQVRDVYFSPN